MEGSCSVLLQIGQRSRKRLWRQKVGKSDVWGGLVCALAVPRSRGADPRPDVLGRALGARVRVGVPGETVVFVQMRPRGGRVAPP